MATDNRTQQLRCVGWVSHAVGLVSLSIAGIIVYCLVHRPLEQQRRTTAARITALQKKLDRAGAIRAEHARLAESLEETKRRSEAVRERIPDQPREAEFLKQLSQIAQKHRVVINDYRRGVAETEDSHSKLTMQVKLTADYDGLCGFLDGLTKLPRVTIVEKLDIHEDPTGQAYPVDITMVLFYGIETSANQTGTSRDASA